MTITKKNHQIYDPVTTGYICDSDPTVFCVSCERTPPDGCKTNCPPGYEWNPAYLKCTDIDECAQNPSPCQNGGSCNNLPGNYSCTCTAEYVGTNCTDFNQCTQTPSPCLNGGTCNKIPGNYTCTCPAAYVGTNCQTLGVDCVDYNPCSNGVNFYPPVYSTDPTEFIFCGSPTECDVISCDFLGPDIVYDPSVPYNLEIYPCFLPIPPNPVDCGSYNPCIEIYNIQIGSPSVFYFPSVSSPSPTNYIACAYDPITEQTCTPSTCPAGTTYQRNWTLYQPDGTFSTPVPCA